MPRKKKVIETTQTEIEKLSELEHIRRKSGMYIGSNSTPIQLLTEAMDNAFDECLSGYSTKAEILKDEEGYYIVRDWGRGIPLTSSKMPGADVPIEIVTTSFSGGKFSSGLYSFSSGMHGIGATLINALSTNLQITTILDKNYYVRYWFEDGDFIKKETIDRPKDGFSTEIRFFPDKDYFDKLDIDMDTIKQKIEAAKVCLPNDVEIILNGQIITSTLLTNFYDGVEDNLIVHASCENKIHEETKVYIGLTDVDNGKIFKGVVNLIPTDDGSNYRATIGIIKEILMGIANKKKIEIKRDDDILVPLRMVTVLKLKSPSFDSQTKNKLTTKKELFQESITQCVQAIIDNYPEFVDEWLRRVEEYRIQLESNRVSKKKRIGKGLIVKGLFEAMDWRKGESELFVCEGLSAGGTLIKCRDPKKHAVLALRGKPLNAMVKSKSKVLQNEVINSICAACGYKPFQPIDVSKCRYKRIIVAADSDADGCSIRCNDYSTISIRNKKTGKIDTIELSDFQKLHSVDYEDYEVLAYDEELKQYVYTNIDYVWKPKVVHEYLKIEMEDGSILALTPNHKCLTRRGWIEASELTEEDEILSDSKSSNCMKVKHIVHCSNVDEFGYDLTTDTGTFCMGKSHLVIHNSHIACLCILLFMKLMPDLIKANKLFIARTPLYGYTKNKQFVPVPDQSDANRLMREGVKLTRFKGLGEMDPDELYHSAIDPKTRRLYKVLYSPDFDFEKEWPNMGCLLERVYESEDE